MLDYNSKGLLMGSCFSESMGEKMHQAGFHVLQNPFGILYQPAAILNALYRIMHLEKYSKEELVFFDGLYHSPDHHGRFSGEDADAVIENINLQLTAAHQCVKSEKVVLMITFGSVMGYTRKADQKHFANCHKIPGDQFTRQPESLEDIRKNWNELIHQLHHINPDLQILFTVSPVRHWKDGAVENQLSKSKLIVSVHEWVNSHSFCHYFPSYEIMMDELRDYRFYKEDMLHPSAQAETFIWEKFLETCLFPGERPLLQKVEKLRLQCIHRPLHPNRPEHALAMMKLSEELDQFAATYPHLDVTYLMEMLNQNIKTYA
jgi:hypothetical protein